MKRALAIAFLAALPAAAQWRHFGRENTRTTGFFGAGFSEATNPLGARVDTGWNLTGGIGVTGAYVGVMLDAMYNQFGINNFALEAATRGTQRYWAFTVDPIFHVNRRGPVDFYLTGGGGIYGQEAQYKIPVSNSGQFGGEYSLIASDTLYKPGVDGGAGFAFNLGRRTKMKFFTEARFHHIFTRGSGASFVPVTLGVRF